MAATGSRQTGRIYKIASAYKFWIELDGMFVAGFTEASGLEAETEIEEYREGGLNGFVHRLPKGTRYPNIVLKRGMTQSAILWSWYESTMNGAIQRKHGAIVLQSADGSEFGRWNFTDAYPVKWSGPQLNASTSDVAFETIEIAHNGLKGVFTR
ncbi:phage tail protein [Paenibacillus radicis (ex Gao et al. 2016)]|uniref:Phage tail protein n=1 Tax=Paenibacillus radicis (ex Gao et al. 2016) TaxID=1737354 RepID=A0A917HH14_9BACL|nr:phage tail protein [Paenibacillus radicis (ex Gao et al. 2016)]GGG77799.1 phage tail protein [Paenibacillus radicis (ex Gao et al. 2016)]